MVDDEPGLLDLHARLVERCLPRCRVVRAADGRQALAAMERTRPDLVLLDLMMPQLDGFGVLEAMQDRSALHDVPVVILTAQSLTQADMARLQRGVAVVLEKGLYSAEETMGHLERALARSPRTGGECRRVVRKAMALIHERYAEPLSRPEIARHVHVSERQLDRDFRKEADITLMGYLARYRVLQARRLLDTTDKSVTEIALDVGFGGSSYFGEVFRREVGLAPREYRRGGGTLMRQCKT